MSEDHTGPSPETLRKLAGMMPSFIKAMEQKRTRGKGVKVAAKKARKLCSICARLFDYTTTTQEIEMTPGFCELCDARLKEGYAAFVCADRFAFCKSPRLA